MLSPLAEMSGPLVIDELTPRKRGLVMKHEPGMMDDDDDDD